MEAAHVAQVGNHCCSRARVFTNTTNLLTNTSLVTINSAQSLHTSGLDRSLNCPPTNHKYWKLRRLESRSRSIKAVFAFDWVASIRSNSSQTFSPSVKSIFKRRLTSNAGCLETCPTAERRPTVYSWQAYDILVLHFKCQPLSAGSYVFLYKVRTFRTSL